MRVPTKRQAAHRGAYQILAYTCKRQARYYSSVPNVVFEGPSPEKHEPLNDYSGPENGDTLNAYISAGKEELYPIHRTYYAVKNNIIFKIDPTTCGSAILQDYMSPFYATIATRFGRIYGLPLRTTNMDEFGMGSHSTNSHFGAVQNVPPYEKYSAGGSSGGSAVAVAAGPFKMALGTDTGGSVRLPAAYTGIVGFKPSYGFVSRFGVIPYANSLDTVGVLARTVAGVAESRLFHGYDAKDPTHATVEARTRMNANLANSDVCPLDIHDLGGRQHLKIGIPLEYNIAEMDSVVRQAWQETLEKLQSEGHTIVPVSLPNTKHALSAYYILAAAEAASNLSKYDGVRYGNRSSASDGAGDVLYSKTRGELFGEETKRRILLGSYTLSSSAIDNYFIKAQKIRRLVQRDFDRVFILNNPLRPSDEQFDLTDMDENVEMADKLGPSRVDFIICPTAPTLSPKLEEVVSQSPVESYMNDVFTVPASLAGLPAISVPFRLSSEDHETGAPPYVGIQVIGQYSDDWRVLAAGRVIEKLLGCTKHSQALRCCNANSQAPFYVTGPSSHHDYPPTEDFAIPVQKVQCDFDAKMRT
ncbi:amidase signature domain-containing protein [Calycina marina]|uniref:Glutamyl-tRNA(Gln) amidotransferase subunit A, mitochondrial n=1 Tax=Calycina marina TaxID=1763456 RepID=A0A9P7YZT9_9HELO|nr:amidase signature domain-containing protein [Calycina marina]